jgi:hypothetical protein
MAEVSVSALADKLLALLQNHSLPPNLPLNRSSGRAVKCQQAMIKKVLGRLAGIELSETIIVR